MHHPKLRIAVVASFLLLLAGCDSSTQQAASSSKPAETVTAQDVPADPLQPRYASTLAEGIDFKRPGYPEFVGEVAGISGAEGWGRWTDANLAPNARIRFNQPLPPNFTLNLKVRDFFGINAGKDVVVTAGDKEQKFVLGKDVDQELQLTFSGVNGDTIVIAAPNSSEPTGNDGRKMGIGLIALSVKE